MRPKPKARTVAGHPHVFIVNKEAGGGFPVRQDSAGLTALFNYISSF